MLDAGYSMLVVARGRLRIEKIRNAKFEIRNSSFVVSCYVAYFAE